MGRQWFSAAILIATGAAASVVVGCSGGCGKQDTPAVTAPDQRVHGLTSEQSAQVLVKVGDVTITAGQFAQRLADLSPYLRARYNSPERRREFLDNMVRFELLAIAAREKGYDKAPDVQRVRNEVMVQKLMEQLFDEGGLKPAEVTEAEIKTYYDAHQTEFSKPAQVRASHIVLKNRAQAERVLKEVVSAGNDAERFRALAKAHNEDAATKDRFGDLRFFSLPAQKEPGEPSVPDAVRTAAFSIAEIGGVHPQLVQSEQGFHIIKLTGKRAALSRSLEETRRLIQNRLWRERREQAIEKFIADLRAKAQVEEHLENLGQIRVETPAAQGAGGPGGPDEHGQGEPSTDDGVHP